MWRLIDDLFFYGRHAWRGAPDGLWEPIAIQRWSYKYDWDVDLEIITPIDPQVFSNGRVIFKVPGWDGILLHAGRTLIGARATEKAWVERMLSPAQIVNFEIQDDNDLTQTELDAWLNDWRSRRNDGGQSVGATPAGLKMVVNNGSLGEADLFLSARNVNRNDIASHAALDGSMADGSGGQDSLTYQTAVGIRDAFYEFDMTFWTATILAAVNQPQVTGGRFEVRPQFMPIYAPAFTKESPTQRRIGQTSTSTSTTTGDGSQEEVEESVQ